MRRIKKLGHEQNTAAQGMFLGMSHIHSGGFEKFKVLRFFRNWVLRHEYYNKLIVSDKTAFFATNQFKQVVSSKEQTIMTY